MLPMFIALVAVYPLQVLLTENLVNLLITVFSIFAGLLFNLLILVFEIADKESDKAKSLILNRSSYEAKNSQDLLDTTQETLKDSRLVREILYETYINISFCILISIFGIMTLLLHIVSPSSVLKLLNNPQSNLVVAFKSIDLTFKVLISFVSYYTFYVFLLTLLMVLKRIYKLLSKRFSDFQSDATY
ncbi:MAG: hypothetical protein ACFB14_11970 [Leptolyngbyaceae cyanobacterium]